MGKLVCPCSLDADHGSAALTHATQPLGVPQDYGDGRRRVPLLCEQCCQLERRLRDRTAHRAVAHRESRFRHQLWAHPQPFSRNP